ncbi:MAG: type II toxin-antitoxin system RelB/DinJ family antitoxin [Oscillospiraceae bacterium]|jgi:DNA-damage-inducible protein J|nr:type II toxin-antitoxin system RelB/DinJ family antitoxin [Oscillospiraceae bacterium]
MSESTNLNIRIDKDLKTQAERVFGDLGMNLTTAVTVFVRQSVREGRIPFEITLGEPLNNIADRGRDALRQIREESEKRGFLSDDEIETEIQAAKAETRVAV